MTRPYYSEYVRHCLRFYTRNLTKPAFKTSVDKNNWLSCESVLKRCTPTDFEILVNVYGEYDTISDNVYNVSKKYEVHQNIIWDLMRDVENKIAKRRGLI